MSIMKMLIMNEIEKFYMGYQIEENLPKNCIPYLIALGAYVHFSKIKIPEKLEIGWANVADLKSKLTRDFNEFKDEIITSRAEAIIFKNSIKNKKEIAQELIDKLQKEFLGISLKCPVCGKEIDYYENTKDGRIYHHNWYNCEQLKNVPFYPKTEKDFDDLEKLKKEGEMNGIGRRSLWRELHQCRNIEVREACQ